MRFLKTAKLPHSNEKEICWFIDVDRPDLSLQQVTHSTFAIHEFLDPARVLFGIVYAKKDASKGKTTHSEFAINLNTLNTSSQIREKGTYVVYVARIRSDAMNHSIGGGYTDREVSQDFDKSIRSGREESSLNKGTPTQISNKMSGRKEEASYTDRFYRPSEEHGRYSINNSSGITHISTLQSQITNARRLGEEASQSNRIQTDDSDNSFVKSRPKHGLKLLSSSGQGTTSPHSTQPYTSRIVDKILRDKANNKDQKQVIVLGGNKETLNGTLTDRDPRETVESSAPTPKSPPIVANYLIRGNYTVNNFGRQYNNYTPTSDIRDVKRTIGGESRPPHESSFEGGYKPSEVFLKKIKDSAKK